MSSFSLRKISCVVRSNLSTALLLTSLSLLACAEEKKSGRETTDDPSTTDDDESEDAASNGGGDSGAARADAGNDAGSKSDASAKPTTMDATAPMQTPAQGDVPDAAPMSMADAGAPAAACGAPGQACCAGDRCGSGCCVNHICLANGTSCGMGFGTCMDNACSNCGKTGQGCCPGRSCQAAAACGAANTCIACGGPDERCCADRQCTGGVCVGGGGADPGVCKTGCGAKDQMCCAGEAGGLPGGGVLGGVLPNNSGMCVADLSCLRGKCSPCGGDGEACCPGTTTCDANLQCIDSKCQKCGQPGQPCCAPTPTNLDGCFGPLNTCQNGACTGMTCGLLNEACCPTVPAGGAGACSATGTFCLSGACKSCGGLNEPCCPAGFGTSCSVRGAMCMAGTCKMP